MINKILKGTLSEISMVKDVCKNSELILPNTIDEKNIIKNGMNLNSSKFRIIHNGVEKDFNANPDLFVKKYNISDFILHVGHIGAEKKIPLGLKAVENIDYPCVIIGNVLNNLESRKCLDLIKSNKNILFLDWVKHSDPILESAYAACKAFVCLRYMKRLDALP